MGIFRALKAAAAKALRIAFPGLIRASRQNSQTGQQLNATITQQLKDPFSYNVSPSIVDYRDSDERQNVYASINNDDFHFKQFVIRNYGSYENYLRMNRLTRNVTVFDPQVDYKMDVRIIKPGTAFTSDHISTQEVIMELLSGVCTIFFIKKTNGAARRLTCTLAQEYIPSSGTRVRVSFFSPLQGDRIGVWDINAQGWKSFYMSSVYKFVRDDTTSQE